jgi:hypothetical protein
MEEMITTFSVVREILGHPSIIALDIWMIAPHTCQDLSMPAARDLLVPKRYLFLRR